MTKKPDDATKIRILKVLNRHMGKENAISMGELFRRVYLEDWSDKINDTRPVRKAVEDMRFEGFLIGDIRKRTGGGYYIARSPSELNEFFDRRIYEALKKLKMVSAMKRISMPELLGQMMLKLEPRKEDGHAED